MDALLSVARARGAAAAAALADAPPGLHAAVALEALYWAASLALLLRRPRKDAHVSAARGASWSIIWVAHEAAANGAGPVRRLGRIGWQPAP